jgi:hypothetical protein
MIFSGARILGPVFAVFCRETVFLSKKPVRQRRFRLWWRSAAVCEASSRSACADRNAWKRPTRSAMQTRCGWSFRHSRGPAHPFLITPRNSRSRNVDLPGADVFLGCARMAGLQQPLSTAPSVPLWNMDSIFFTLSDSSRRGMLLSLARNGPQTAGQLGGYTGFRLSAKLTPLLPSFHSRRPKRGSSLISVFARCGWNNARQARV